MPSYVIDEFTLDDRGFLTRDGPACHRGEAYCEKKLCFTSTSVEKLATLLYKLSQRDDCFFVKLDSEVGSHGLVRGRCFLTSEQAVGHLWAKYRVSDVGLCSVQDEEFTARHRWTNPQTKRFQGEPIGMDEVGMLHDSLYSDQQFMAALGGNLLSKEETKPRIACDRTHWQDHGFGTWLFTFSESQEFAARAGMKFYDLPTEQDPVVGLLCHVTAAHWGKGIATELVQCCVDTAFTSLGIERVMSWTLASNKASQRVMEKCGMQHVYDGEFEGLSHRFYAIDKP